MTEATVTPVAVEDAAEARAAYRTAFREAIEAKWRERALALGYKPKTKAYQTAEVEYFVGAMAALEALAPDLEHGASLPGWVIAILSGRPIVAKL